MTRIVCICSGKGGAGKTFLTANLGLALAEMGKDVIVVDANLTTPNLGMHLGVPLYPKTLHDAIKGKARIHETIYQHESGLKIIPGGISLRDLKGADPKELSNIIIDLLGHSEIILIDAAAGLGREALAAMEAADELLLVTNPELTSVTDALKAAKLAEQMGTRVRGVVINRTKGKEHEMTKDQIKTMLERIEIIGEVKEHEDVQKAIAKRNPIIHHKPSSSTSDEIRAIAAIIAGERRSIRMPWYRRIFRLR